MTQTEIRLAGQRFVVREATVEELLDLRLATLRPGRPRAEVMFPGDGEPATRHVGAFDAEGRCLGCVSCMRADWDGQPAWQLRGMATHPDVRGQGLGRALLAFMESVLRTEPGPRLMWCNARAYAVDFYRKHGWEVVSEEFMIPNVCPHFRMVKRLPTAD